MDDSSVYSAYFFADAAHAGGHSYGWNDGGGSRMRSALHARQGMSAASMNTTDNRC
jgi:hypothetical protein